MRKSFTVNTAITFAGVVIALASALLINMVVAAFYGPAGLGVFNVSYAVFVIGAQLGALGMPMAVLKYCAQYRDDSANRTPAAVSALLLAGAGGGGVSLVCFLGSSLLADIMHSEPLRTAIALVAPGIALFALNKVLLNYLNALQRMRSYSLFFGIRPLLALMCLAVAAAAELPARFAPGALSASELAICACMLFFVVRDLPLATVRAEREWLRRMFAFGILSLPSGFIVEMNTRADVLILALFVGDYEVGIYSMAAILIEGLNQIPYVVRRNIDPFLPSLYAAGEKDAIAGLIRKGLRLSYPVVFLISLLMVVAYPFAVPWFFPGEGFMQAYTPLVILLVGFVIQGGYMPFSGILIQCGRPGLQSVLLGCMFLVNLAGNLALIPSLGINGAALGTSLTCLAMVLLLKVFSRRYLQIRI